MNMDVEHRCDGHGHPTARRVEPTIPCAREDSNLHELSAHKALK
jgi:hypothetical protein